MKLRVITLDTLAKVCHGMLSHAIRRFRRLPSLYPDLNLVERVIMPNDPSITDLEREIREIGAEIDFRVAIIARGGPDASGVREELTELESRLGDLLDQIDTARSAPPGGARA
jgi:hypothetical protein